LNHKWFKKAASLSNTPNNGDVKISDDVLQRLRSFKGVSTFKKAAMNLLVKTASESEVKQLRETFEQIDVDGTGMIKASELQNVLMHRNMNTSGQEIANIISQMDYHGNKKINYSEFLAATIDIRDFLTDSRLNAAFHQFDTDSSGKITKDNIYLAMQKLGREITMEEIEEIIMQHD